MAFGPFSTRYRAWTPKPPEEVADDLTLHPDTRGSATIDAFDLGFRVAGTKNSWRAQIKGTMRPVAGGTLIEASFDAHLLVVLFTILHGIPFLGLTWLIGYIAYRGSVPNAQAVLDDAAGVTLRNEEVDSMNVQIADPRAAGADSAAPLSLWATSGLDGATFELRASSNANSKKLTVRPRGIALDGNDVSWERIAFAVAGHTPEGASLEIGLHNADAIRVPAGGHSKADLDWLAEYLNARNEKWSPGSRELEAREQARQLTAKE